MRTGRQERTHLRPEEWPEAGAFLQSLVERSGVSKRGVLAAMGYVGGTNRLNSYYRGDRLPSTGTLLAICGAIGASYVEVVDRFGYYHEIIKILDDLVWLGARWLDEDEARGEPLGSPGAEISRVDSLRGTGVLYWKNEPITWGQPIPWSDKPGLDPRNIPEFMNRYFIGSYLQPEQQAVRVTLAPIEFVPGGTFSTKAPLRLDQVDPSLHREKVVTSEYTWFTVVPKPIGLAIVLGALAFPRRGDVYEDGARQYRESLGREAHNLVKAAKTQRSQVKTPGRPRKLHTYLQRACDILDDSRLAFDYTRPMAGEYVLAWADSICRPFTHCARLAAFAFWGEAGSEVSGVTSFTQMPQLRKAELPDIETLTTYS
jgi:hypothetical protein